MTLRFAGRMVWEHGSVVIVNLTNLIEGTDVMCHRYWPDNGSEVYGVYEVSEFISTSRAFLPTRCIHYVTLFYLLLPFAAQRSSFLAMPVF